LICSRYARTKPRLILGLVNHSLRCARQIRLTKRCHRVTACKQNYLLRSLLEVVGLGVRRKLKVAVTRDCRTCWGRIPIRLRRYRRSGVLNFYAQRSQYRDIHRVYRAGCWRLRQWLRRPVGGSKAAGGSSHLIDGACRILAVTDVDPIYRCGLKSCYLPSWTMHLFSINFFLLDVSSTCTAFVHLIAVHGRFSL
jgi:hypothetical protein